MWKYITAVLAGALATLGIVFATQKPKNITVEGDYLEDPKIKDNRKIKAKKGILSFLERDPDKKAAAKKRRALKKQKKELTL